jgi:hypothetical protein
MSSGAGNDWLCFAHNSCRGVNPRRWKLTFSEPQLQDYNQRIINTRLWVSTVKSGILLKLSSEPRGIGI